MSKNSTEIALFDNTVHDVPLHQGATSPAAACVGDGDGGRRGVSDDRRTEGRQASSISQ
jgi:hypothetical protein